jgi:hypothetical protein
MASRAVATFEWLGRSKTGSINIWQRNRPVPRAKKAVDRPLTPKQEQFCLLIVYGYEGEFITQDRAYRLSYNCKKMSNKAIWVEASRLLANPRIALRVAQLRNAVAIKAGITVENETEKLELIYERGLNGYMDVERDVDGNVVYVNPEPKEGEPLIPKVRVVKPNLGAAVKAREQIEKIHGLLDRDRERDSDIPPVEERMKRYLKDPEYKPPPVSGKITRVPMVIDD